MILFVANPTSRSGKAGERIDLARAFLDAYGLAHEFRPTLPDGETSGLVQRAIDDEGYDTIIYLGGDGTFNEVAKGICQSARPSDVRLGMLPSGTANDQGKSFGISSADRAIEDNVRIIGAGQTVQLDVGEVEVLTDEGAVGRRELFFDSLGWGLSAAILAFRNRDREQAQKLPVVRDMYRDQMVYVRAAVHELALSWVTRDRFTAEISVDGEVHMLDRLSDLVVSNTAVYAGEWVIDPENRCDDGRLDVVPFRGVRDWTSKLILHHKRMPLTEEMLNRIGVSHTPMLRGSEIDIHLLRPGKDKRLPAQLDGEELEPADHFRITVRRRLLRVIVPEKHHWI